MNLRMLRDMCRCRHTAIPYSKTSHVPGDRGEAGRQCLSGGAEGRVGCKAFDQMAGELEA
jgi:hypothetical protein